MSLKTDFEKKFKEMMTSKGYNISDSLATEMKDKFLKYESSPSINKYDKLVGDINKQIANTAEARLIVKKLCEDFGLKSRNQVKNPKTQNSNKNNNKGKTKKEPEVNNTFFDDFDIMAGADLDEKSKSKSKRQDEHEKILDGKRIVENLKNTNKGNFKWAEGVTDNFISFYSKTFGKIDIPPVKFVAGTVFIGTGIVAGMTGMAVNTVVNGIGKNIYEIGARTTKKAYKAAKGTAQRMADKKAKKELEFGSKVSKELVEALSKNKEDAKNKVDSLNLPPEKLVELNKLRGVDENGNEVQKDFTNIDIYQDSLVKQYDRELRDLRVGLKLIKVAKLHDELVEIGNSMTPPLQSSEIADFINNVKLDKDGMIVYPKKSRINEELFKLYPEIDREEMEDHIARVAEAPDPSKMTDIQVEQLVNSLIIDDGEIMFYFGGDEEIDPVVRKYADEVSGDALYTKKRLETMQSSLDRVINTHNITTCLLDEVTETNKYNLACVLEEQFTTLKTINDGYEQRNEQKGLSDKDVVNRNKVRRTAESKVNAMARLLGTNSKNLASIIQDKENKDDILMRKATIILVKDMQKVVTKDQKKVMDYKQEYDSGEKV